MMARSRRIVISGFLVTIGIGWLVIMWLDWSRLFHFAATGRVDEFLLSRVIKLGLSFAVTLLVWTASGTGLSSRDRFLMRTVFALFSGADIAFFCAEYHAGIGIFALGQIVFIFRNAAGIPAVFSDARLTNKARRVVTTLIVTAVVHVVLMKLIFGPHTDNPMFGMIVGYSVLLCLSLNAGIITRITGYFPGFNSWLLVAGVVMLYFGDMTVGLNLILPHDRSYIISTSLTWFFYLPAILLFALSAFRWGGRVTPEAD